MSKGFTYKQLQEAVAKAVEKNLPGDLVLPVVFPNALGLTPRDFWKGKHVKKTKTIKPNTRRIRKKT